MRSKIIEKQTAIISELKKRINSGYYKEKLPAALKLSGEFKVNFKTMNKAIDGLVEEGLVTRYRKRGTLIGRKYDSSNISNALIELLFVGSAQISVHPYFGEVWRGIMEGLKDSRYKLVLSEMTENQKLGGLAVPYRNLMPCAGRLLIGTNAKSQLDILSRQPQPFVLAGEKAHDRSVNCVYPDVSEALGQLIKDLYENGLRRVAFIGMTHGNECGAVDKFHAYLEAIQKYGPINGDLIEHVPPFARDGYRAMNAILKRRKPQVVVLAFDHQYQSVCRALDEAGLIPGRNIRILGIDGLEMEPELEGTRIPRYEIGLKSIRMLLDIISGKLHPRGHEIILKASLK